MLSPRSWLAVSLSLPLVMAREDKHAMITAAPRPRLADRAISASTLWVSQSGGGYSVQPLPATITAVTYSSSLIAFCTSGYSGWLTDCSSVFATSCDGPTAYYLTGPSFVCPTACNTDTIFTGSTADASGLLWPGCNPVTSQRFYYLQQPLGAAASPATSTSIPLIRASTTTITTSFSTSTSTTVTSTSSTSPPPVETSPAPSGGGSSRAWIAGPVVGGLFVLAAAAAGIFICLRRRRRNAAAAPPSTSHYSSPPMQHNAHGSVMSPTPSGAPTYSSPHMSQSYSKGQAVSPPMQSMSPNFAPQQQDMKGPHVFQQVGTSHNAYPTQAMPQQAPPNSHTYPTQAMPHYGSANMPHELPENIQH